MSQNDSVTWMVPGWLTWVFPTGGGMDFSVWHHIHTGSGAQPAVLKIFIRGLYYWEYSDWSTSSAFLWMGHMFVMRLVLKLRVCSALASLSLYTCMWCHCLFIIFNIIIKICNRNHICNINSQDDCKYPQLMIIKNVQVISSALAIEWFVLQSVTFRKTSRNLARSMFWKNVKLYIILGVIITVSTSYTA